MTKEQIIQTLESKHQAFISYINSLDDADFVFSKNNEKWSAAQDLEHIRLSVLPLSIGLKLPKLLLRWLMGKSNRPSKSYSDLVARYQDKLRQGSKATKQFIPKLIAASSKQKLVEKTIWAVKQLCKNLERYSEEDLDTLLLPHPILGKLTLREMMYFTIYHVEHHHKARIEYLIKS